jgi:hypothetical protein
MCHIRPTEAREMVQEKERDAQHITGYEPFTLHAPKGS